MGGADMWLGVRRGPWGPGSATSLLGYSGQPSPFVCPRALGSEIQVGFDWVWF